MNTEPHTTNMRIKSMGLDITRYFLERNADHFEALAALSMTLVILARSLQISDEDILADIKSTLISLTNEMKNK